jgi:hypothetical protein
LDYSQICSTSDDGIPRWFRQREITSAFFSVLVPIGGGLIIGLMARLQFLFGGCEGDERIEEPIAR